MYLGHELKKESERRGLGGVGTRFDLQHTHTLKKLKFIYFIHGV